MVACGHCLPLAFHLHFSRQAYAQPYCFAIPELQQDVYNRLASVMIRRHEPSLYGCTISIASGKAFPSDMLQLLLQQSSRILSICTNLQRRCSCPSAL